ncbi:hypothetical protein AVEN_194776-1 [Araneus ventricosus]|uniref:Uncharacterized protein n=1 Tax=Araneus ventricosus TaxID=182803 RepID=A0A4Y2B2F5_ARAVE|nr:hypothetical protein AVEN_194776-1 [Araneus ventricosus]
MDDSSLRRESWQSTCENNPLSKEIKPAFDLNKIPLFLHFARLHGQVRITVPSKRNHDESRRRFCRQGSFVASLLAALATRSSPACHNSSGEGERVKGCVFSFSSPAPSQEEHLSGFVVGSCGRVVSRGVRRQRRDDSAQRHLIPSLSSASSVAVVARFPVGFLLHPFFRSQV